MGSSSKRKKEKVKDFKKPKLKVGKTRPKASNTTNTSFQAKSIVLKQQSLSTTLPSTADQFLHHLSLLASNTDAQRRDAVAALVNVLSSTSPATLPQPAVTIINKVRPLLIDASKTVRTNALELFKLLPVEEIVRNIEAVQIYVHIGLTHMVSDIRLSSLDVLEWLLQTLGPATTSCTGGWTGTMKRLLGSLGWQLPNTAADTTKSNSWTSMSNSKLQDAKSRARQINVFALFLSMGLRQHALEAGAQVDRRAAKTFPLFDCDAHIMGGTADPYRYLDLFSETETKDEDAVAIADPLGRAERLHDSYLAGILHGVDKAKKEGGEVGRATKRVELALGSM